jgi:hypothetical protein
MPRWLKGNQMVALHAKHGASDAVASEYGALLRAVTTADAPATAAVAGALLAVGAAPRRVHRSIIRALLPRATLPADNGWPHGLFALNAALFLIEALPSSERPPVLARAAGLAVADWPAENPVPQALPLGHGFPPSEPWSAVGLAQQVRVAALAAEGATAEWALAALLSGSDHGSAPDESVRRAAYGAVLGAAAQAERRLRAWGHLLVTAQHAVEVAALLPPSHTLLALRPALWAIARASARPRPACAASPAHDLDASHIRCALTINQRPARPGETLQWAIAFRTRPTQRVVEEALASGLARAALLDAAFLAVAGALAAIVGRGTLPSAQRPSAQRFATLAAHALLALHAARRADDLADNPADALLAALGCLERLARHSAPWPSPRVGTSSPATPGAIARAAVAADTPHALALGEVILAECEDAQPRNAEYTAALLGAAGVWLAHTQRQQRGTPTERQ